MFTRPRKVVLGPLLECVSPLTEETARNIPGLDVATLARVHGVASLLVPDTVSRDQFRAAAVAHARGLAATLAVSRLLDAERIPHAILKGALLQEQLYGQEALRPYSDIDVLVDSASPSRARRALTGQGWTRVGSSLQNALHFHEVFVPADEGSLPLEVHRSLVDRANLFRIPDHEVLARATRCPVPGGVLPGLAVEDQFLYLCLHAAKHGFLNETALALTKEATWFLHPRSGNRLLWLLDIAVLLDHSWNEMDWSTLSARIRDWNVVRPLAATLAVLAILMPIALGGAAIGQLDLERWRPRAGNPLLRRLADRVTAHRTHSLRTHRHWTLRPARMAQLPDLLFPAREDVVAFYSAAEDDSMLLRRLVHPVVMLKRLCLG